MELCLCFEEASPVGLDKNVFEICRFFDMRLSLISTSTKKNKGDEQNFICAA